MMLTGRSSPEDIETALKLGASEYMIKPFDRDVFLAKFDSLLSDNDDGGSVHFAELTAHSTAEVSFPTLIAAISEMGITLHTQSYIDRHLRIQLNAQIFQDIGILCPPLRAAWCRPLQHDSHYQYEVFVSFIGLDEASMRKIRQWIAACSIQRVRAS